MKDGESSKLVARRGLVGTVINGVSISLIQNRVKDVAFKDLEIIPLGLTMFLLILYLV